MSDTNPTGSQSPPAPPRPPSFMRRFAAGDTTDPDTLVGLACDENYWVRRQAVKNPATPAWIIELLVRAGATPDLRGKGEPDPTLDGDSLIRLVEGGPWAQQLVAEHPNTPRMVLEVLVDQPSPTLRLGVARHPNASPTTLARLCCATEEEIRAAAAVHPNRPEELLDLLAAAGANPELKTAARPEAGVSEEDLRILVGLGPWGRYLAARHPDCPPEFLEDVARDPDWRVRTGLLDNPTTPKSLLEHLLGSHDAEEISTVRELSRPEPPAPTLEGLARHRNPEVRMAVARHPAVTPEILSTLASDGTKEVRAFVVDNPNTNPADIQPLVRAGSTPDLMALSEPDASMSQAELADLSRRGLWARQLAVRHPNTSPATLARLVCDAEPKIREWAAVHPNAPQDTIQALFRAGSGTDFQGFMPPDPDMLPEDLRELASLGPWAEWVVANHPNAPVDLLERLVTSPDSQVRVFVARNPNTPESLLAKLAEDDAVDVKSAVTQRSKT